MSSSEIGWSVVVNIIRIARLTCAKSECTMSWHGAAKNELLKKGAANEERAGLYDPSFMANLIPALPYLEKKGIKLAVNAGASDTEMLAKVVVEAIKEADLTNLKVAWIEGDDVMDSVNKLLSNGYKFENICFGGELKDWGFEPVAAQCYLGGAGIAAAFQQGADIIICGMSFKITFLHLVVDIMIL